MSAIGQTWLIKCAKVKAGSIKPMVIFVTDSIETVFEWKSEKDSEPNKCHIRIFWITWETAIIIASDISIGPGKKIVNATKEIISFASQVHNLAPNKLMLVEHYLTNDLIKKDTYLQVLLTDNQAIRYEIENGKLSKLIGKML